MCHPQLFSLFLILLVLAFEACESQDCSNPPLDITVSQSQQANFKTIQSAIDSVSEQNSRWIHIHIFPGVYKEQIQIPMNKPCIYLEGSGSDSTSIEWDSHLNATFDVRANNTVAKSIAFLNTLNKPILEGKTPITQAVAALIHGDKCAFYDCAFYGVQDTLYDHRGRHYYHNCYIQGGTDFVFGYGQSIFEASTLNFSMGKNGPKHDGCFTAQRRTTANESSGFVFKNCTFTGTRGNAILGRSLDAYARVIIANSYLSNVVTPVGWNSRTFVGHEETITFVEVGNRGPGANQSKRVKWMKHLSGAELDQFLSISYIDNEGWFPKLPTNIVI
ncbi:probable pectinesterase 29 [Cicer arietinum]|uniref:pectinesterase n=1 Tax=Cicer arietinum TaxID=3827 RepID=A0A1S2YT65_CICAR|nr:probable pectinesterase 29 [Cicer arietinum]